jgi:hypothetical protein
VDIVGRIARVLYGRDGTRRNPGCARIVFEAGVGAVTALLLTALTWPVYVAYQAAPLVSFLREGDVQGPYWECFLGPALGGALAGILLGTIANMVGQALGGERGQIVGAVVGSIIGGALIPIAALVVFLALALA